MSGDKWELPWYAGGRGGEEGGDGEGGLMFILPGSWSVLDGTEKAEREVETVGVGDEAREGGSDESLERGDEGVDEMVWDMLTNELFGA